ncbi:hypothetical protein SAMN05428959_107280 [Duganella sp. CF517]|uniref:hypothetical protein n=1 Tax=Duganella sp. CF517 TaxID=1881038 RepID=UPI0008C9A09B|nr:hypothetical protein [Duganella sp. CF517]SEO41515.1 hypothetical protein SAMN05428959_107280 [Duganella sp. CF517]
MDQQKLRSLVFEKTGVKIDIDDPIFALVALNEAVLEEAVGRHIAAIDAASLELTQHARLAGGLPPVADAARKAAPLDATNEPSAAPAAASAGYVPTPPGPVRPIATQSPAITPRELRLLGAAAGIAMLSALIVVGAQAVFSKPPPAPVIEAKALTPEQTLALRNAEKLTKAIEKLEPKARNQLQAELQK